MTKLPYQAEIDGLRAIAVVSVVLYHANFSWISGGYLGVDIFFVISGFLITRIIFADLESGEFSLLKFYRRRILRIVPVLLAVMLFSVIIAWMFLLPSELVSFSKSLASVSLFSSNFFFARQGSYFETSGELKPLLHTWSLSVEEQFYFAYPIIALIIFCKFYKQKKTILLVFFMLTFLICLVCGSFYPNFNFYFTISRAWEFLIGALASTLLARRHAICAVEDFHRPISYIALGMVLIPIFLYTKETPAPSLYTLIPTIGTALLLFSATGSTSVAKLLRSKSLVSIGVISYSIYLWHQPILVIAKLGGGFLQSLPMMFYILLTIFISFLSWKYIERPARCARGALVLYISTFFIIFFLIVGVVTSKANFNFESQLADRLATNFAVFVPGVNEREFVEKRINLINNKHEITILGSSRMMQVGTGIVGRDLINYSVSGASIEDHIAIWSIANRNGVESKKLYLGVDPWLFNSKSNQDRWLVLAQYYNDFVDRHGIESPTPRYTAKPVNETSGEFNMYIRKLYALVSHAQVVSNNDYPGNYDKVLHDGSRIYSRFYPNIDNLTYIDPLVFTNYAMSPYEHSDRLLKLFEEFLQVVSMRQEVILVLSPYHPVVYSYIVENDRKFIEIEQTYRQLAAQLGLKIIGSYDPRRVGCLSTEFYDGMHPKASCMRKILTDSYQNQD